MPYNVDYSNDNKNSIFYWAYVPEISHNFVFDLRLLDKYCLIPILYILKLELRDIKQLI